MDSFIAKGEKVVVEGYLTLYDEKEKRWKPLDSEIFFYLDGKEIGFTKPNFGKFSFKFLSPSLGRHRVDIKFEAEGYEPSYKSIKFQVVESERKKKILRIAKLIFLFILLLCIFLLISIFIAKLL
ncbi:MAG: hypothetical protein NZ894_04685 [Archaeoglobaceae archaeon]|nr:hypothetical protein [Archaeoglobaceae archaeon]